jgi:hypothetical protein
MGVATAALAKSRGEPSAPLNGQGQAVAGATAPAEGAASPGEPSTDAEPGEAAPEMATDEEIATLSDKAKARFQDLTHKLRAADEQITELKGPADQYGKIMQFMDQFGLTTDDMVIAYEITARMKHDPVSAFEKLTPIYQKLAERAGYVIPDDLVQKIKTGFIDEATARDVARTRAEKLLADERIKRAEELRGRETMVSLNTTIQQAVADWDTTQISKDPDFERKRPLVEHAARSIMAKEGRAKDPDAAINVLQRALKAVNDGIAHFRPPVAPTPRMPNGAGNPATSQVAAEPKSLAEAAMQGLKGTYNFNRA